MNQAKEYKKSFKSGKTRRKKWILKKKINLLFA